MNRFAIIIPYFGKFKPSISLFLESCNRNPDVDWHIFTDCPVPENVELKENIQWHPATLDLVSQLIKEKLGWTVCLNRPYKLCDLKPFYGLLFEEYLAGYEYWGFGDVDVIYGRLTKYLEKIHYRDYDKINWMGHLCFVRNTPECCRAVLARVPGTVEAESVVLREENIGFDERDYNHKCIASGMKIHTGKWAADIDVFYWRMRCADRKTFHILLRTKEIKYAPRNYRKQMFAVLDGAVCRIYLKHRSVRVEEFAYIHFRKEVPICIPDGKTSSFLISREGFIPLDGLQPDHYDTVKQLIERYNDQENALQELHCFLHYLCRNLKAR